MHLYFPFDEENDIELLAYNIEQLIFYTTIFRKSPNNLIK